MKALYSSLAPPPNTLTLTSRPLPSLSPSTILVKVHASGINPSDAVNGLKNAFRTTKPIITGRDFAGTVHSSNSSTLPAGTPVYGTSGSSLSFTIDGTHAEYVLVPEALVVKKPSVLSYVQAGAVGTPYATSLDAIDKARLQPGKDVVLVLGATGATGKAAVNMARYMGCKVLTASRQDVTDINVKTDPELRRVTELLDGKGPDVVIDCVGSTTLMKAAMAILERRGRYILFAAGKDGGEPLYELNLLNLYRFAHTISGVNSTAQSFEETRSMMSRLSEMFEGGLEGPDEKELVKIGLEDAVEAYNESLNFAGKKFVIVMEWVNFPEDTPGSR